MSERYLDDPHLPDNIVMTPAVTVGYTGLQQDIQNGERIKITGLLCEVIINAAREHPTWKFIVRSLVAAGGPSVTRFHIQNQKGDTVGDLWRTNYLEVAFTNERVRRDVQRGTARRTTKLDTALKLIKKFCNEPPLNEEFETAREMLRDRGVELRNQHIAKHKVLMNGVVSHLRGYIEANIELFYDEVPTLSGVVDKATLLNARDYSEISNGVVQTPAHHRLTVLLKDDKYVLQRATSGLLVKLSDTLPDEVRMKIGLLKLAADGQFIRDVGYKQSPTSMMLVYAGPLD